MTETKTVYKLLEVFRGERLLWGIYEDSEDLVEDKSRLEIEYPDRLFTWELDKLILQRSKW